MLIAVALLPAQRLRLLGKQAPTDLIPGLQLGNRQADLLHGFLALTVHQGLAQQIQFTFRLRLLRRRQQHLGLDQHQVAGHGNEFAGDLHVQALHFFQIIKVLLQNGGDGHILDFNFVLTQQFKDNIQRALEILPDLGAGMDDALQPVFRFGHNGSL